MCVSLFCIHNQPGNKAFRVNTVFWCVMNIHEMVDEKEGERKIEHNERESETETQKFREQARQRKRNTEKHTHLHRRQAYLSPRDKQPRCLWRRVEKQTGDT